MKTTKKIVILTLAMMILTTLLASLMSGYVFRNQLILEENRESNSIVNRIVFRFERKEDSYIGRLNDWSHWDEPFNYLNSNNPTFIEDNITGETFQNLDINLLLIFNSERDLTDQLYYDLSLNRFLEVPEDLAQIAKQHIDATKPEEHGTCVVQTKLGYYILAFSDITNLTKDQERNGFMIFGRLIDDSMLYDIEEDTESNITFHSVNELDAKLVAEIHSLNKREENAAVVKTEGDTISTFYLMQIMDMNDDEVIIATSRERKSYIEGMSQVRKMVLINSILIAVVLLFLLFLLKKYVAEPIELLTKEVVSMELIDRRLAANVFFGSSEMGILGDAINGLLDKVDSSNKMYFESEERFKVMFEEAPLGIALFDFKTGWNHQANRKFGEIIGRPKEDLNSIDWVKISHPDDMLEYNQQRFRMIEGEISGFRMNKRYYRDDGTMVWTQLTIALLDSVEHLHCRELVMIEDISERKAKEDEIIFLNYHDVLTGLYNRRFFEEAKKLFDIQKQLPLSAIVIDIDGLKLVNDGFGYSAGDQLIVAATEILKSCCRSQDIISRIGGDEFCILLPQTSREMTQKIVERIDESCQKKVIEVNNIAIKCSISTGIATKTSEEQDLNSIIITAEDAMRKYKLLNRRSVRSDLISSIKATMLERSNETLEHADRMARLARAIGKEMQFTDNEIYDLELAATLHDIGKMSINETVLEKALTLSEEEWIEIKKHPEVGYRIALSASELIPIANYILTHHERWDGTGYPQGLKGEKIPLIARIVSLVDAYDAMIEDRPYRKALTKEEAAAEIRKNAGSQFDPKIAKLFVEKILNKENID